MRPKPVVAGAAALALLVSSSVAVAAAGPAPIEPASEGAEGSELRGTTGWIVGGVVVAIVALLIAGLILDNDTGAVPLSP